VIEHRAEATAASSGPGLCAGRRRRPRAATSAPDHASRATGFEPVGNAESPQVMFLFFSSRLGCLGSLLVSAVITLILLVILGVL
jgi:hypothetical protein